MSTLQISDRRESHGHVCAPATESDQTLRLTSSATVTYNPHQTVTGRSCKPRRSLYPRLFVIGTDEHPAFSNRYHNSPRRNIGMAAKSTAAKATSAKSTKAKIAPAAPAPKSTKAKVGAAKSTKAKAGAAKSVKTTAKKPAAKAKK